ncbi:MAG: hypothetical protein NTX56_15745 [Proteobacteria bacterium]|nr:hypothetical protein [Pseudomonadota bacterium]
MHKFHAASAGKPDYSEEKCIPIIRNTWQKISGAAHGFALAGKISLRETLLPLIPKVVA